MFINIDLYYQKDNKYYIHMNIFFPQKIKEENKKNVYVYSKYNFFNSIKLKYTYIYLNTYSVFYVLDILKEEALDYKEAVEVLNKATHNQLVIFYFILKGEEEIIERIIKIRLIDVILHKFLEKRGNSVLNNFLLKLVKYEYFKLYAEICDN
jgi:hypothetical protein